ncbi:hypothetical protein HQ563_06400 [bacterium]|nr:hypothetical protein [bacterium]
MDTMSPVHPSDVYLIKTDGDGNAPLPNAKGHLPSLFSHGMPLHDNPYPARNAQKSGSEEYEAKP